MTRAELEVLKDLYNVVADIATTSGIYSVDIAMKMAELCEKIKGLLADSEDE